MKNISLETYYNVNNRLFKNKVIEHFPVKMPWGGREVPHGLIEVNQSCNIRCKGCYKDKSGEKKSLEEIKHEVDLLASKRNLCAITVAGGEPTLYPQLEEVFAYIKQKGIICAMLTNGTILTPERLERYKQAGLDRLFLHIDKHQHGRQDISEFSSEASLNELRDKYIQMAAKSGIAVALALTLYRDSLEDFLDVISFCHKHPYVDRILITNYSQNLNIIATPEDGLSLDNYDIYEFMSQKETALPAWYLPSSHDEKKFQWLFYTALITRDDEGGILKLYLNPAHPMGLRLIHPLNRLLFGHYRIEGELSPFQILGVLSLYTLLSFSPLLALRVLRFLKKAYLNKNIKIFALVFQQSPTKLTNGEFETCKDCPDATIRNGKLIPVCLVDQLEPIMRTLN